MHRTRESGDKLRIGAVGAISRLKGLSVLQACARHAARKNLPMEFVVVGYTSDDIKSTRAGLNVTGPYSNDRAQEHIHKAKLDAIFFASTWPETYSYTLSIALETGLPIVAFDIGAISERIRTLGGNNLIVPLAFARNPQMITNMIRIWLEDQKVSTNQNFSSMHELVQK
ncbi:MAG: glycosyltransferase [Pseudomonadota bacterium]